MTSTLTLSLLQDHWRDFTAEYSEYFEPQYGSLRTRVEKVVVSFWNVACWISVLRAFVASYVRLSYFFPSVVKVGPSAPRAPRSANCFLKNFCSKRFLLPTSPTVMSCSPSPSDCEESFLEIAICWPTFRAWATRVLLR